jgi:hypothetical protein
MADITVRRVGFGYFVRPAAETGTGGPRVDPCLGYVVSHPTQYAADRLAWQARRDGHSQPLPGIPEWIDTRQQLDPRIVYFAHDHSVWVP